MIGDNDLEDAYDAGDPIPVRLHLLARIVAALDTDDDPDLERHHFRRAEVVRLMRRIADEVANGG